MPDYVENISIFAMSMAQPLLRCIVWSRSEARSSRPDREHHYCTSESHVDQFRHEVPVITRDSRY
jgi:hypothetical protein